MLVPGDESAPQVLRRCKLYSQLRFSCSPRVNDGEVQGRKKLKSLAKYKNRNRIAIFGQRTRNACNAVSERSILGPLEICVQSYLSCD